MASKPWRMSGRWASALGLVAGFLDAYGFLKWHAFGANMTGNTVIFAISLHADPWSALLPATLVVAFVAGAIAGRAIVDRTAPRIALIAEALLLCIAALRNDVPSLALIAFTMGMQSASVAVFDGVRVSTSFLSGNYVALGRTIADAFAPGTDRVAARQALIVIAPLIASYAIGAVLGAFGARFTYELFAVVPVIVAAALLAPRSRA